MTEPDRTAKPTEDAGVLVTWRESSSAAKALLLGLFVNRLGAFIQVFLVLFLVQRGFTEVQAGVALGLYAAGVVVGTFAGGAITDRLGGRFTIVVSMAGSAPLLLAVLYLGSYPVLLVAVAAVGAVSNAFRPASAAMLSQMTPEHRTVMIFAMQRLTYNLGSTAAPLIGAGLALVSYDLLFWAEAGVALAYAGIAVLALPRRRSTPARSPARSPDQPAQPPASYRTVLADRRFVLFLLAGFVNALVYMQYLGALPVAMRAADLPIGPARALLADATAAQAAVFWYGAMVSLNGLIVITCELPATKVVQRWPARVAVMVGFGLLGAGMAAYALPLGLAAFVIGTLVWSLAEIIAGPTMFAYPAVASPEHLRGRYLGAASGLFHIGSTVAPVAGLALWSLVGSALWPLCGAACAVGAFLAWHAMRPRPTAGSVAAPGAGAEPATASEGGRGT
ncbi:MAG: MFS transporter [Natronosporangium sp.]